MHLYLGLYIYKFKSNMNDLILKIFLNHHVQQLRILC